MTPGPNPPSAYNANGTVNTAVVTSTANPCPGGARPMNYDVSVFNKALPTPPFADTERRDLLADLGRGGDPGRHEAGRAAGAAGEPG